jgi:hypothetical protein
MERRASPPVLSSKLEQKRMAGEDARRSIVVITRPHQLIRNS